MANAVSDHFRSPKAKAMTIIVILLVSFFALFYFQQVRFPDTSVHQSLAENKQIIHSLLNKPENHPLYRRIDSVLHVHNDVILTALKTQNRQMLLEHMKGIYKAMQNEFSDLKNMHFHNQDGSSFLRLHFPERFGDDLSKLRPMITAIREGGEKQVSIECGKRGCSYRVAVPIRDENGLQLGVLEMGLQLSWVRDLFAGLSEETKVIIFLDNKHFGANKVDFSKEEEVPSFDSYEMCITCRGVDFAKNLPVTLPDTRGVHTIAYKDREFAYETLDALDLVDYQKKIVGKVVVFIDSSKIYAKFKQNLIQNLTYAIPIIGLLSLMGYLYLARLFQSVSELQAKVDESQKFQALNELLSNIAHHWRQPLSTVNIQMQNIEDILEDGGDAEEILPITKNVSRELQRLSSTIDRFRKFYKDECNEKVSFYKALDITLELVGDALKDSGVEVQTSLSDECRVFGKADELVEVLSGMLLNVRDISLERKKERAIITMTARNQGRESVITVSDDAGGIDPELLPTKLFQPYVTTGFQSRDKGLGLYMVHMIITQRMGGKIMAENGEKGAVFTLRIPNEEA